MQRIKQLIRSHDYDPLIFELMILFIELDSGSSSTKGTVGKNKNSNDAHLLGTFRSKGKIKTLFCTDRRILNNGTNHIVVKAMWSS